MAQDLLNQEIEPIQSLEPEVPQTVNPQLVEQQRIENEEAAKQAQIAEQAAKDEAAKIEEQENEIQYRMRNSRQPRHIVESELAQEKRRDAQSKERSAAAKVESVASAQQSIRDEIVELQANKEDALSLGVSTKGIDERLAELTSQLQAAEPVQLTQPQERIPAQISPEQVAVAEQAAIDTATTEQAEVADEVEAAKEIDEAAEKVNRRTVLAKQKLQDEVDAQRAAIAKAKSALEDEDLKTKKVDMDRFWNDESGVGSTWRKVIAGIAIFMGAAGSNGNQAAKIIRDTIDKDIAQQNLDNKTALAKREQAFKLVGQEIDRLQQITDNDLKQQKLDALKQKAVAEAFETRQERLEDKLSEAETKILEQQLVTNNRGEKGLSDAFLTKLEFANPKLGNQIRQRAIALPNSDKIRLGANKAAVDKLSKVQNEVIPAIQGAKRIMKLSKSGSRLDPVNRAKIATDLKAVIGQLRIPFTGPGVLTDTEFNRLLETVGDPNRLFAIPDWERTKLMTVINKLSSDLIQGYKNAGVTGASVSEILGKREAWVRKKMKQSKAKRADIETVLDNLISSGSLSAAQYGE